MATTSPDNIWTPNSSEDYDYVIDAATTATSVQNALTKRANSYTGTTTERTAFTTAAPEGTLWSDTNGDKALWIKQGASWQRVWSGADTTTPSVVFESGWSFYAGLSFVRVSGMASVYLAVTYSGPTINVGASGDTPNQTILTFPVGFRPIIDVGLGGGISGRMGALTFRSSGDLVLSAVGGTANVSSGENFSGGCSFILA